MKHFTPDEAIRIHIRDAILAECQGDGASAALDHAVECILNLVEQRVLETILEWRDEDWHWHFEQFPQLAARVQGQLRGEVAGKLIAGPHLYDFVPAKDFPQGEYTLYTALSQQPEPTDTFTAVDMATAAAQGLRDGQAAVEQAPAQDEREAFEAHMRLGGYSNPEKHHDGSYVSSAMELWWQGWKARATRPAQTEQQPVAVPQCVRDWYDAKAAHVAAVDAYNARLAFVQKHEPFGTSVNPEYKIMEAAEREARSLIGPMFTGLTEFFAAPIAQIAALRYTNDGSLAECPCCGSLDVGGAHDTVHCYRCGLTVTKPRPLKNAIDAWNMRTGKQTAPQPEQSGLVEATLPAVRAAERLSSAIIHRMTDRQYQKVRSEFGDLQDALAVCRAALSAQGAGDADS